MPPRDQPLRHAADARHEQGMRRVERNEFWSRVFTFVPTATKADGEEIDEKAFRSAIEYQIENGVHGVCIFGSTGGNGSSATKR